MRKEISFTIIITLLLSSLIFAQIPKYQNYDTIINQLKTWQQKYDNTALYKYGHTSKDLSIFQITGKEKDKKKVLIFGCVHSNEPLATSMAMGYTGYILFHRNENNIKEILDSRDIYVVPVVCPDLFPNSRAYDGIDPNRNFDKNNSVVPIEYLKQIGLKIRPNAALSLHTFGREYLIPYGNSNKRCPDEIQFQKIVGTMAKLSDYRLIHACEMYGHPIYGSELDWFYSHKTFSIVQECGTHQHIPNWNDIEYEFKRTFPAFLYFLKYAPEVEIK